MFKDIAAFPYPGRLLSASLGHMANDIMMSSIAIILTVVSGRFDLDIGQISLAIMITTFVGAFTQPFFGMLADRLQGRWQGAASLLWVMFFYALIPFAPNYVSLVGLLAIASLGSASIHPVGMVNAADAAGPYPASATSVFFLFGQTGLSLGPLISGFILQNLGLAGLPIIAVAMAPVVLMMGIYLRHPQEAPNPEAKIDPSPAATSLQPVSQPESQPAVQAGALVVTAFFLLILLRATTQHTYMTLLPKFFDEQGYTPATYGSLVFWFTLCGAIGTFVGGFLGDRLNRRLLIFWTMLLSVPFSYFMLRSTGGLFFVMAGLSGFLLNIPHSIQIVMAQRLLPARKGFMGGAVLGFMFASGAGMAWIAGELADVYGLFNVFTVLAFVPIGAGACAFFLPSTRVTVPETMEPPPVSAAAD